IWSNYRFQIVLGLFAGEGARATWFDQFAEGGVARFKVMFQAQHGQGDVLRFRSGQAHDANAAAARRSSDGDDGVIKIHGDSFEFLASSCKRKNLTTEGTEVT